MGDNKDKETIARMITDLRDREDVWWSPLLTPGRWETVKDEAAVAFLSQWIEKDRQETRPPFAALYPPLKIVRLNVAFAPITVWQVAVDLGFNVGVVDLIEAPRKKHPRIAPKNLKKPLLKLHDDGKRPPKSPLPTNMEDSKLPQDAEDNHLIKPHEQQRALSYASEIWRGLPQLQLGLIEPADNLGPTKASKILSGPVSLNTAEEAVSYTSFLLSLSRRAAGRFSVLDPDCPLAALPDGPHGIGLDVKTLPIITPSATKTDTGWDTICDAWYTDGIWRLTSQLDSKAVIKLQSATRIANIASKPPEAYIGCVRYFDCRLPDQVRLPCEKFPPQSSL